MSSFDSVAQTAEQEKRTTLWALPEKVSDGYCLYHASPVSLSKQCILTYFNREPTLVALPPDVTIDWSDGELNRLGFIVNTSSMLEVYVDVQQ